MGFLCFLVYAMQQNNRICKKRGHPYGDGLVYVKSMLHELNGIAEITDFGVQLGRRGIFGGIADGEQAADCDVFGQTERRVNLVGIEPGDPAGADAEFPSLEHHMRANDRRVGLAGAVAGGQIVFPRLVLIVADGENGRRAKGKAANGGELLAHFFALNDVDLLGLEVAGCGRYAACFQDCLQFFFFNGILFEGTDGKAFFCEFKKVHVGFSFLSIFTTILYHEFFVFAICFSICVKKERLS